MGTLKHPEIERTTAWPELGPRYKKIHAGRRCTVCSEVGGYKPLADLAEPAKSTLNDAVGVFRKAVGVPNQRSGTNTEQRGMNLYSVMLSR